MKKSLALALCFLFIGCTSSDEGKSKLEGQVKIDGSSTVFPVTEAVAEEFGKKYPRVRVTVGVSGTGGGFEKFINGETDINDASRKIKDSEKNKAQEKGVKYLEIPVAYDGISIVANPENDWVDYLTVKELNKIWKPGSQVKTWQDVRSEWPAEEIKLYGPGTDSGTFDYFTKVINGKHQASRSDFTKSEDDNMLVQGVAGDKSSLGFFGYAYYEENKDKLKLVPVKMGDRPSITPSIESINKNTYKPLSRPLFIYVRQEATKKEPVIKFVHFYLNNAETLTKEVGYVPLPDKMYQQALKDFEQFSKD